MLTVARGGQFDVWKLPDRQKVFSTPASAKNVFVESNGFTHLPASLAVSPDRTTLALCNKDGFNLFDLADGKMIGKTQSVSEDGQMLNVWGAAFSPDGKSLVSHFHLYKAGVGKRHLGRWAVPGGQKQGLFAIPDVVSFSAGLSWWGKDHVLLWNAVVTEALLYDMRSGAACRRVERVHHGRCAIHHINGQLWYATGYVPIGPAQLTFAGLPEADLQQMPGNAETRWYLWPQGVSKTK